MLFREALQTVLSPPEEHFQSMSHPFACARKNWVNGWTKWKNWWMVAACCYGGRSVEEIQKEVLSLAEASTPSVVFGQQPMRGRGE